MSICQMLIVNLITLCLIQKMQQNRLKLPGKVSLFIFPFEQPILRKEKNALQTKRVRHSSPQSGHTSNESTSIKVHYKIQDNVNNAPKELFFQQHGIQPKVLTIFTWVGKRSLTCNGVLCAVLCTLSSHFTIFSVTREK